MFFSILKYITRNSSLCLYHRSNNCPEKKIQKELPEGKVCRLLECKASRKPRQNINTSPAGGDRRDMQQWSLPHHLSKTCGLLPPTVRLPHWH